MSCKQLATDGNYSVMITVPAPPPHPPATHDKKKIQELERIIFFKLHFITSFFIIPGMAIEKKKNFWPQCSCRCTRNEVWFFLVQFLAVPYLQRTSCCCVPSLPRHSHSAGGRLSFEMSQYKVPIEKNMPHFSGVIQSVAMYTSAVPTSLRQLATREGR